MTVNLLTLDDITAIAKLSRNHVRDVVVKSPDFPQRAKGTGPRKPRWPEEAVKKFFAGESAQSSHTTSEAA